MSTMQIHGWLAELDGATALRDVVGRLREAGYTRIEAFSPIPVDGLAEVIQPRQPQGINPIAGLVLAGALAGGIGTLALEWYASVIAYPMNIGGRPNASWPAFIPAALEMTFLFAAIFGVIGLLAAAGLPKLYHPVFHVDRFEAASRDGFFVLVRADDRRIDDDGEKLRKLLEQADALRVDEVSP